MVRNCYCGRCQLDTEDADFVVNERPLCDVDCITRAREAKRRRVGGQYIGVARSGAFDVVGA
jgi:hypothetical protein